MPNSFNIYRSVSKFDPILVFEKLKNVYILNSRQDSNDFKKFLYMYIYSDFYTYIDLVKLLKGLYQMGKSVF